MLLGVAAMIIVAGCSKIKELETRVDSLDGRLTELEKKVAEMNIQIDAIQKLLSGKYFVKDVSDLEDGSGYKLTLVDVNGKSTVKVVLNGEDGETPVVGVRQDSDGNWYWTVNGEWLLQGGQKVRADGEDGASPQVKVEDGLWKLCLGSRQETDAEGSDGGYRHEEMLVEGIAAGESLGGFLQRVVSYY